MRTDFFFGTVGIFVCAVVRGPVIVSTQAYPSEVPLFQPNDCRARAMLHNLQQRLFECCGRVHR